MADRTIKIDSNMMKNIGRQLLSGAANYIGVGNKKLPVVGPTVKRIVTSPTFQSAVSNMQKKPTDVMSGLGTIARTITPMIAPNVQNVIKRTIPQQPTTPQLGYTPSYTPSLTPAPSYASFEQPMTTMGATKPMDKLDFNSKIQEIVQKRAMLGNLKLQGLGEQAMVGQLGLQQELANIPEFKELSLAQAKRFQDMRSQGYENMYQAASDALAGRQTLMKDLVDDAVGLYADTLEKEAEVKPSFNEYGEYMGYFDPNTREFVYANGSSGTDYSGGMGNAGYMASDQFNLTEPSKYKGVVGKYECGEAYNYLTDGPKVGNDYSTKMAAVSKQDNPQVGNGLVIPIGGQYGHIETVIGYDPNSGTVTTVGWNRDTNGSKSVQSYTIQELRQKYGDNWGFTNSILKSKYAQAEQPALNITAFDEQQFKQYQDKGTLPKFKSSYEEQIWTNKYNQWASGTGQAGLTQEKRQQVQEIIDSIENLKKMPGFSAAVGFGLQKYVPFGIGKEEGEKFYGGTQAADFNAELDRLINNLVLPNLPLLKGPLSDKDIAFLKGAATSLKTSNTEEQFRKTINGMEKKYKSMIQGSPTQSTTKPVIQSIRVIEKSSGRTGTIPANEFDPSLYTKI
jgi:hypothetical protein